MRLIFSLLKLAALAIVAAAVVFFVLTQFFGLRVELAGSSKEPIFSFLDLDAHYAGIERDRLAAAAKLGERIEQPAAADPAPEQPPSEGLAQQPDPPAAPTAPWPQFRGPNRDGISSETSIRTDWPADGLQELWRQRVGGGYASMSVAEGKVFTIEQRRDQEVTAAYDLETGIQVWEHSWPAMFEETLGGDGPRATPSWHDGRLYSLGAAGELRCLSASDGRMIWRTNILDDSGVSNSKFGMPGSPLVHDGKVIVVPGGSSGKAVAAYDASSGKIVWQAQSYHSGYSSPLVGVLAGREQLLIFTGDAMVGLDPADGALLWEYPWVTNYNINVAQPIVIDADHVWFSSGYGKGSTLLKIVDDGGAVRAEKVWESNTLKCRFASAVFHQGSIYGFDESILAAIDPLSGARRWKGGRYGYGQLLLADGHLIVLSERGDLALLEAAPEAHREIARFSALAGKTWSVPAIADGKLLVRNQTEMAAYQLGR